MTQWDYCINYLILVFFWLPPHPPGFQDSGCHLINYLSPWEESGKKKKHQSQDFQTISEINVHPCWWSFFLQYYSITKWSILTLLYKNSATPKECSSFICSTKLPLEVHTALLQRRNNETLARTLEGTKANIKILSPWIIYYLEMDSISNFTYMQKSSTENALKLHANYLT